MKRLILIAIGIALVLNTPLSAQQASQNIPVLPVIPESSGDADWYLRGDGYLQRQVEPTIAVSTRNPDHVLSFFVDYRAVDVGNDVGLGEETQTFALAIKTTNMMLAGLIPLPEIPYIESPPVAASEAWVGGSASHDGGMTWSGFFMPGAEFDGTQFSVDSPVYGLQAATDPVAVAGPCGYVYVAFMAFTRGDQSKLVVARFQDLNDSESGKTWQYQGTWELASGNNALNGYFLDKPHIALDVFRDDSDFAAYGQYYDSEEYQCGHRVYTSYSTFNGLDMDGKFQSKINFDVSVDLGETWDKSRIQQPYTQNQGSFIAVDPRPRTPTDGGGGSVYLVWRHFNSPDAIVMIKTTNYGKKWSKPIELTGDIPMQAFDQPTIQAIDGIPDSPRELAFRSNAFPTAAVTAPSGNVFVAWQELVDTELGTPRQYDPLSSPRIVMVKSTDGGGSWTDIYGVPGSRVAVDMGRRDDDDTLYPPAGFGALPTPRESGPQVKPWLSFGGGEFALGYTESRGMYQRGEIELVDEFGEPLVDENDDPITMAVWNHQNAGLSENGFISDIDRVMDFRVAMLDPETGQVKENKSIQVSRYPIRYTATFDGNQVETVADIAPVLPELCDPIDGLPEYCQPSLNFVNKNHSGSGHAAFMGDYPGMSPILPLLYDFNNETGFWEWRWAVSKSDVPYPAFHVVFPDNRHLIPPTISPFTDPESGVDPLQEWERYPYYSYPTADTNFACANLGSRNTDVLTAKVNAELVLSAPTTYKKGDLGGPTRGYPISVFNQSGETRFYQLHILGDTDIASFAVVPGDLQFPADKYIGVVEIFPYSSTSQMVYVSPTANEQIRIEVTQVYQCDVNNQNCTVKPYGEQGFVTLNPDPSNLPTAGSELQKVNIAKEWIAVYDPDAEEEPFDGDLTAINPFVRNATVENPFVRNPFVRNPFVRNTAIEDDPVKVIDTTWSIQATGDSGAGSYLPVINIDNADEFLKNYAFQLLIYKNASHGTFVECESFNVANTQIISNVSQSPGDTTQNPFVRNPFVRNPFVRNPFVRNPFVRNSAISVAPADGIEETNPSAAQASSKNLIDNEGNIRVPRVPEKIFITLRAFQLVPDSALGNFEYDPYVDDPAFSAVPTRCTSPECIKSLSPDLVPEEIVVLEADYSDLPERTDPDTQVPVEVPTGATITFNFTVRNLGNVPADAENRALRHAFYLSKNPTVDPGNDDQSTSIDQILLLGPGALLPDHVVSTIDPLPPGDELGTDNFEQFSSVTVEIPYDIDPADYDYLILFVDDYREVSEVNEPNNQHAMLIDLVKLNHAPTFTAGDPIEVLEDSGSYSAAWATELDDGDPGTVQGLEFVVNVTSNAFLFADEGSPTINPAGVLLFTLAPHRYGTAEISVVLEDDGGDYGGGLYQSTEATFTITVLPVNDAPSFDPVIPVPESNPVDYTFDVVVLEDSSVNIAWTTNITAGPFEDGDQTVFFSTPTIDNPALFAVPPAISPDGALSFTPAPNVFGTALLTVYLADTGGTPNGGVDRSPTVPFTITVTPVRDYDFLGLFDPWKAHPVYTAKVGSAIPLKWQYAQNETVVNTGHLFPRVMVRGPFDCGWDSLDPAEPPPTPPDTEPTWVEYTPLNFPGASDYRYSESSGTWQFNWDTDGLGEGCYNAYVINDTVYETDGPFRIKLK